MREILFRGKRLNNGEWKFGSYSKQYGCHEILLESCEGEYGFDHYGIDPSTLGQYTGLTDKNGKKIFEGDICQIKNHHLIDDTPFVIEWNDGVYNGWVWHDLDESDGMDSFENGVANICEVIGNIYDGIERK